MRNSNKLKELSFQLVNKSLKVKSGQKVLIEYDGNGARDLALVCAEEVLFNGGIPIVQDIHYQFRRFYLDLANEKQIRALGDFYLKTIKEVDSYLLILGSNNIYEFKGITSRQNELYMKYIHGPFLQEWISKKHWVVTRFPSPGMAQLAGLPTKDFEDFFFSVTCLDYEQLEIAAVPLYKLMNKTKQVRIIAPNTDLSFSISGIDCFLSVGKHNIPDGECLTAPVQGSINGKIHFNCKTLLRSQGVTFDNIFVEFKNGKVISASSDTPFKTKLLNDTLQIDDGASSIGEFAIAFNPLINAPIGDLLFDEKINGSFHLAFGNAFPQADNGNRSLIHWDMIQIQTTEYGGGEIWFDEVLIRKDGIFIPYELRGLNPKNQE